MGSRLSMPKGPAGTTEMSHPRAAPRSRINNRMLVAPAAAFTMACILFVYTRTSIRAAKANAQRHRDADSGGQGLDLLSESRRRHGLARKVEEEGTARALASMTREQLLGKGKGKKEEEGEGKQEWDGVVHAREREQALRDAMGSRRRDGD